MMITFQNDLELVGEHLERGYAGAIFWNDMLPIPRSAGVLKEILAWIGSHVHGTYEVGR